MKAHTIQLRKFRWTFSAAKKYWFNGSALLTHFLNVYTLLVPDNEKYYIRVISQCADKISTKELRSDVMQFCRQESLHGIGHRKYWQELERHGVHYQPFLIASNFILYRVLEPIQPLRIKLAIVAAVEHLNASWANTFLSNDILRDAEDSVRELFYWHFAEEIEHKSVAHDVLREIYPGYGTRVIGGWIAFSAFYMMMGIGTVYLLLVDKCYPSRRSWRHIKRFCIDSGFLRANAAQILRYFSPSFDPQSVEDYYLVEKTLNKDFPLSNGNFDQAFEVKKALIL